MPFTPVVYRLRLENDTQSREYICTKKRGHEQKWRRCVRSHGWYPKLLARGIVYMGDSHPHISNVILRASKYSEEKCWVRISRALSSTILYMSNTLAHIYLVIMHGFLHNKRGISSAKAKRNDIFLDFLLFFQATQDSFILWVLAHIFYRCKWLAHSPSSLYLFIYIIIRKRRLQIINAT